VRRILGKYYELDSGSGGPSWLTFLGQAKDSLWSIDLFRCESLRLRTHWVLVVMDQFTRRIIGLGIHRGTVDGPSLCSMFQRAIQGQALPKYLSTDNDPLSVPPMAGQPSRVGGDGNQDRTLRAAIASLC
jgi:putative transposase